MKHAYQEVAALEKTVSDAENEQVKDLNDLQLALVGGGSGDPILY
jgi:hypothetical protein